MNGVFVIFLFGTAFLASAVPLSKQPNENSEYEYPRFIKFSDDKGQHHEIDLQAEPDSELLKEITKNPSDNEYLLFTRRNQQESQTLNINNVFSITNSSFDPNLPTVVVVYGWRLNLLINFISTLRNAFLEKSDCNVIVMEWTPLAWADYSTASFGVPAVGRELGKFMNFLHTATGAPYSKMHLVGFGLGAHIVGNAGREMGGKAARITGLDPAGPLWNLNPNRLNIDDGVYVEAIHTDGSPISGGLGIGFAIGDADFFPNGGLSQPNCISNFCNHNRAWELFVATVTYNHLDGRECTSVLQVNMNNCSGARLPMGNDDLNKTGSGMYRLDTSWRYPF